jgi:hypothetical protein
MKKALLTLCCLSTALSTFSQLSFLDPIFPRDEWIGRQLVSGDFNGDHLADFAYVSDDLYLHYLYQKSDHSFQKIDVLLRTGTIGSFALESGDLNKDGLTDLVVFNLSTISAENLTIYISTGQNFSQSKVITNTTLAKDIEIADMNGDGNVDILLSTDGNEFVIFENNGTGGFVKKIVASGNPTFAVKAADINHDNRMDIVALNYTQDLVVYLKLPSGEFSVKKYALSNFPTSFAVADFNNDTFPEVIVSSIGDKAIKYFINDGTGNFSTSLLTGFSIIYDALAVTDLDGDGLKDIAASGELVEPIVVLKNLGNHQFQEVSLNAHAAYVGTIVPTDFDKDGFLDIVALSTTKRVDIYSYNNGFTYNSGLFLGTTPTDGTIADMNKDGHIDIVIADELGRSISVFYGDANQAYSNRKNFQFAFEIAKVVTNDFNSDSYPDLVFTTSYQGNDRKIGIILSQADGTLSDQYITVDYNPTAILETSDVNKDGFADIVATINTFLGDGAGHFTSQNNGLNFSTSTSSLGDLNQDGYTDIVVSDRQSSLKYGINDGTGKFVFSTILTTRPSDEISVVNINNDVYPDIVIAHNNSSKTLTFLLNGNGSFTVKEIDTSPIQNPRAVFYDLNNDGLKDILSTGNLDVRPLLQDNAGNFIPGQTVQTYLNTYLNRIFVADLNNDSKKDIIGLSSNGKAVTILLNDLVVEPTTKASNIFVSDVTSAAATITMTPGNGKGRIVVMHESGNVSSTPSDGIFYTAKLAFGQGTIIGSQNYVVASGNSTQFKVENLKQKSTYTIAAFEYNVNEKNNIINYNTSATTISFTTKATQTINPRADLTLTNNSTPPTVVISATSSLPVTLQKISGNISVADNVITILGPGPAQVSASQAGNDEFEPISPTTLSFCINPPIPIVKIEEISNPFEFHLVSSSTTNNQWYYNEQIASDETSQVYIPKKNGVFAVKVDYSGCSSTSEKTSFIYTGLVETESSKIKVYPNPTSSVVYVDTTVPLEDVKIMDNLGREIHANVLNHTIDFAPMESGIYFLLIRTETELSTKKIVKM